MQSPSGHASIVDVLAAAGLCSARKVAGAGPGPVALATAPGTVRPSISLPLERGAGGREAKVLSVVREEALYGRRRAARAAHARGAQRL